MTKPEVIVIGGGCNGLAAAALLAKRGYAVLLLERRTTVGGLSSTVEFTPGHRVRGFRPFSTGTRLGALRPLGIGPLQRIVTQILHPDGYVLEAHTDAWEEFRGRARPLLQALLGVPRASGLWSGYGEAVRRVWHADVRRMLRSAPLSARDLLEEFVSDPVLRGACAVPMLARTWGGPWSPFGSLQLLLHDPVHGIRDAALADALCSAATENGVEIQTETTVVRLEYSATGMRVRTKNGAVIEAPHIVAACSPRVVAECFLNPAVTGAHPPLRSRGTCAVLALALNRTVDLGARTRLALDLEMLERAFDCVKWGRIPKLQALEVTRTSDASASGPDTLVVHALQTPYRPEPGWTGETRTELVDRIVGQLTAASPFAGTSVAGWHLWTPTDIETQFGVPGGHMFHFERDLDQLLSPMPFRLPAGVHWAGQAANRECGQVCAGGVAAARQVLRLSRVS